MRHYLIKAYVNSEKLFTYFTLKARDERHASQKAKVIASTRNMWVYSIDAVSKRSFGDILWNELFLGFRVDADGNIIQPIKKGKR